MECVVRFFDKYPLAIKNSRKLYRYSFTNIWRKLVLLPLNNNNGYFDILKNFSGKKK